MRRFGRTWVRYPALLLAGVVLLLAACGSDDNGDTPAPPDTPTEAPATPAASGEQDAPVPLPDLGALELWADSDCLRLGLALSSLFVAAVGGTQLDAELEAWGDLAGEVPAEVRGEFDVVADAYAEFFRLIEDAGVSFDDPTSFADPEVQEAMDRAVAALNEPRVEAAMDAIEAFFDEVCPEFS